MTDPTFVRACSADLERVLSFVKTYYEFDAIPFSATEVRSGLEALLRDLSLGQIWLIRVGHEDVGYVVLTFGYDLEFGGPQATITELYIVDRYRRLGLGTKTLRFVEATCRELGVRALELQVESKNMAAQAFYPKLVFEPNDRITLSKLLRANANMLR